MPRAIFRAKHDRDARRVADVRAFLHGATTVNPGETDAERQILTVARGIVVAVKAEVAQEKARCHDCEHARHNDAKVRDIVRMVGK